MKLLYTTFLFFITIIISSQNNLYQDSLKSISLKTTLFGKNKNYDSAIIYTNKLIKLANKYKNTNYLAKGYYKLGYYYNTVNNPIRSYNSYNQSYLLYKFLNDSANITRCFLNMSIVQKSLSDFNGAQLSAIEGLHYSPKNHTQHLSGLYSILGFSYKKLNNYPKAIQTYQKALLIAYNYQDSAILLNNMATTYTLQEKYATAITILSGIDVSKINPKERARIVDNLAFAQFKQNQSNTVPQLLQSLKIRDSIHDLHGQHASLIHLTNFYQHQNTSQALLYAKQALKIAKQIQNPDDELEALSYLIDLKENAKEEWSRFKELNDSLIEARNQAKNQFAYIRYESEKHEKENLELKTEKVQNQIKIEKAQKAQLGLIALIVLGIIATVATFFILRNRHQQEKERKIFETENRLAKKVHDEVGNDLHILMNKIQHHTNIQPIDIVDDLDKTYQKARDIAHESSPFDISFEYCQGMLTSFNTNKTTVITRDFSEVFWKNLQKKRQENTVYRVLQELMTNMKKYSQATFVILHFVEEPQQWVIHYSDNGIGINFDRLIKNGLINAENRMESIHGRLIFDKTSTKGVKISLLIPK